MYITPYEFDQYLFADLGCLKAELLMRRIDTNTLKMTNAKDLYFLGFHKEYAEKDFTGAFHCYSEANKLNPKNNLYKRSLAYFYKKSLGSTAEYSKAKDLYTELGNEDDLHNISILEFYINNPFRPLYIYKNIAYIFDKIRDETATSDEMYNLGHKLLSGEEIEQN